MVADWGDEGEIDLLDFFAELTIYTTSSCLVGKPFRDELDSSFARHYHELEHGTDAIAYVDPYADIESFRLRDAAREKLVALVQRIIDRRRARGTVAREDRDLLDVLISLKNEDGSDQFTADVVTGIFISMMFAGHHTSSGTASWAMIELMRHPEVMASVVAELDELYADGSEVSFQALRSIPVLESVLKETLRLHPPLIILMRVVQEDFELLEPHRGGLSDRRGVRPRALHRPAPGGSPEPLDVDPLRRRQAPLRGQRVRDDADEGDLLGHPARLRVHAGPAVGVLPRRFHQDGDPARATVPGQVQAEAAMRVVADTDVCQAHQLCQGEAPDVFGFDQANDVVRLLDEHPDESRRADVTTAVKYCPAFALSIEEDPDV
jgi:ferredoxin